MSKRKYTFKYYMNLCKLISEGKISKIKVKDILGPVEYNRFMRDYYENYQTMKVSNIALMEACYTKNLLNVSKSLMNTTNAINNLLDQQEKYRVETEAYLNNPTISLEEKKKELLNYMKITEAAGQAMDLAIRIHNQEVVKLTEQKEALNRAIEEAKYAQLFRFLNIL